MQIWLIYYVIDCQGLNQIISLLFINYFLDFQTIMLTFNELLYKQSDIFKNIVINFIRGIATNRGIEKINDIENQLTDKNIEIKI